MNQMETKDKGFDWLKFCKKVCYGKMQKEVKPLKRPSNNCGIKPIYHGMKDGKRLLRKLEKEMFFKVESE